MKPLTKEQIEENLRKWFKEKWVRFGPDGKIRGSCARGDNSEGKPKCLPQAKAHALGKKGRAKAASRKRRQDPDAERSGKAINVKTKESIENPNTDYVLVKELSLGPVKVYYNIPTAKYKIKHGLRTIITGDEAKLADYLKNIQMNTKNTSLQKQTPLPTLENEHKNTSEDLRLKNVLIKKVAKKLDLGSAELNLLSINELQNLLKHGSEKSETDLKEFVPDNNGPDGRWYTDDEMVDIVGQDWESYTDTNLDTNELIEDAQAWLDDNGYNVVVMNVKSTDAGFEWYITGSFFNPKFSNNGVVEGKKRKKKQRRVYGGWWGYPGDNTGGEGGGEMAEGAYEKSEEDKRSAQAAQQKGDEFSFHVHMSDYYDNLAKWSSQRGRHSAADRYAAKSEQHHEQAMSLKKQGVAEDLLNENVTELYHGTLAKNVPSILANGLNPTVGEFTRSIYANKAKPLVFAADASGSRGVYCALVGQMHAKLNITTYPPSAEDVAKHCAILVISKDVGKFRQYNAKRRQGSKEPTDYTSEQTIHIDKVITGKELLQWIKTHNADRGEMCPIDNQQGVAEGYKICPECGGPAYSNSVLAEKQDACYHKVRSRYKVWPSAYASGALVQCRKKGAKNWGNKSESVEQKVNEVAVSKQQQKFFGMVHALQKGEKVPGASKELKSVAKEISKKAASDFASTKHKGLPEKVKNNKTTENQKVNEVLGLLGQAATRMAPVVGRGLAVGGGVVTAAGSNSDSSSLQYCVVRIGEQQGNCFNTRQEAQSYLNGLQDKQNYAIKSSMGESKLYYSVTSTSSKVLSESFNMQKDSNGWYLKETASNKEKLNALRAFGSPKIVIEGYDPTASNASAATLGPDNVVSPVGSVPKTQRINSKKQGKKNG